MSGTTRDRRVVVVTGGGGGIGAAIATELGRLGDHVVTVDPLVSVDGTELLHPAEETTAARIVASGGSAQASNASVTDRDAIVALFAELVDTHGRLDAVVNVAGITRPTGFAKGTELDWHDVLTVHLDGYLNVLGAALPLMAAAGRGHILGVTSGSGWRAADAGAYSCAKRAVASLTWQLGKVAPEGVTINAISPIAMTRMVTAALERAAAAAPTTKGSSGPSSTGGLSLGLMPQPEQLGPLGAHLVGDGGRGLAGQILYAGGSEVAVLAPPRLLEVVRTSDVASLDAVWDRVVEALVAAEADQRTTGGTNPRFGRIFDEIDLTLDSPSACTAPDDVQRVALVTDQPALGAEITRSLEDHRVTTAVVPAGKTAPDFDIALAALQVARARLGELDAVVLAVADTIGSPAQGGWRDVLAEHDRLVGRIHADACWTRAVAELASTNDRPLRVVSLIDASTSGGRSRAQAAAQLARSARRATESRVAAFSVGLESPDDNLAAAALVAGLLTSAAAVDLSGAELVVGAGWIGLRSHPRPTGSIVYGGPKIPPWFDDVLMELCP